MTKPNRTCKGFTEQAKADAEAMNHQARAFRAMARYANTAMKNSRSFSEEGEFRLMRMAALFFEVRALAGEFLTEDSESLDFVEAHERKTEKQNAESSQNKPALFDVWA